MSTPSSALYGIKNEVWKWIAIGMTGAFFSLLLGQYTPNRNITTNDQLNAHIADEAREFRDINRKLDAVTDYIAEEKGKEAERQALSNTQRRQNPQ